ncbi:MFS transporter [Nocardioides sp.]|uniref:MFS transporter n=1 Tax=Nocardioides sp. TaxID=35761 RepID=UPI0027340429|nr:MFS transporter [Nocardioides sp.]MDP3891595.1 MFS transporter [Nocardioides sp.]
MPPRPDRRSGRRLILLALVVLAVNLRPAAVSVGPVLAEVTTGLSMSHTLAGVLTSLPVVAFAGFGAAAPWSARRLGLHRTILVALLVVTLGLAGRSWVSGPYEFLALTMLALAGMATANVLLPSLVKLHFPERIGTVTALYTTALAIGLTCSLLLTVPIAESFGGWRVGLGVWALVALASAVPWLALAAHDRRVGRRPTGIALAAVARTRLGLAMAVFFGLQSLQAYSIFGWFAQLWRDNGFTPTQAGALVGIVAAVSIPLSLWIPGAAARRSDQRGVLLAVMSTYPMGYVGLMLAPHSLAVIWAVLVGIGACTFPLILSMIALRSRTPEGTAALSGFTQSAGYLLAAAGPFAVGATYDVSGGWTLPLGLLLALTVPQLLLGLYVARPGHIEDQLAHR